MGNSVITKLSALIRRDANSVEASPARDGSSPIFVEQNHTAMMVATVYSCVKLISESVANLPLQYQRLRDGYFEDYQGGNLHYLFNVQPDNATSAFDFWRRLVQNVLLDGNAYVVPRYDVINNVPDVTRLALCNPGTVQHDTTADVYEVNDSVNGIYGRYDEDEIIHVKGLCGSDPKRGISVLTYARVATQIATAGDLETRKRFITGGNVRGLVTNDSSVRGFGKVQDKQLRQVATDLDDHFNDGKRIVGLPGDVDFKLLSLSSTDMQFLESRKFAVREICRFFGVHPSFIFDDTSNNYKSAEQANVAFLSHTLNPLLRAIEIEFTRKLISSTLCDKRRITFDRRGLYSSDLDGMMRYRNGLLQTGATVNEVRRMDGLRAVDGGDTPFVSANLKTINELITQSDNGEEQNN